MHFCRNFRRLSIWNLYTQIVWSIRCVHNLIIRPQDNGGAVVPKDPSSIIIAPRGNVTPPTFPINAGCCSIFSEACPPLTPFFLVGCVWLIELENCLAKGPRAIRLAGENGVTDPNQWRWRASVRCWQRCFARQQLRLQVQRQQHSSSGHGSGWWAKQTFINFKQLKSSHLSSRQR